MNIIESIILGIIQGLTEFLPISSSGHLALADIFGFLSEAEGEQVIAFFIILHMGTLLAVILYMRKDITHIVTSEQRLIIPIMISTVITAAVAIPLKKVIDYSSRSVIIIGVGLLFTAGIIAIGEYVHRRRHLKKNTVSIPISMIIGLPGSAAPALLSVPVSSAALIGNRL